MNELELIKAIYEVQKKADIEVMKLLVNYLLRGKTDEKEN